MIGIGGDLGRLDRVELLRGFDEIAFAGDVVAFGHRTRLVPGHLHRDALGNSGAHKIADGCSSQVMWYAAGAAGSLACLSPRLRESHDRLALDLLARPMKNPGTEHAVASQALVFGF